MNITAELVKKLRGKTGAGVMDCKEALTKSEGDIEKAIDYLRKKGIDTASKKAGRQTTEGQIGSYIHTGGKIGVLVDIRCETDFVAKTDEFKTLVKEIAMHVAALAPRFIGQEDVRQEVLEKEREILRVQAEKSGKPAKIIDKIVDGRLNKFYQDNCLLEQSYFREPEITINDLVKRYIAQLGENMKIQRFTRFQVGEEL
ncbi:translation elongation factor Ts [candidate division CSSED10-310 bacterium]|uniref:Elongation factor Ts n=1 Tax=candidate division CSSED10-310 bacterium TaxID=2855610 RepID=A0ABV6YVU3_UNCC1